MQAKVIYRDASVRGGPSVSWESVGTVPVGTIVDYSTIVQEQAGKKEWIKLSAGTYSGKYINSIYPNSAGEPVARVEFISGPVPIPGPARINYAVVNYTDETGTHDVTLFPE